MDTNRIKTVVRDAVMEVMPDIREELRRIKQNERRLAFAD